MSLLQCRPLMRSSSTSITQDLNSPRTADDRHKEFRADICAILQIIASAVRGSNLLIWRVGSGAIKPYLELMILLLAWRGIWDGSLSPV